MRMQPPSLRLRSRRVTCLEVLQVYAIIATGGKQYRVSEGDIIMSKSSTARWTIP